MVDKEKSIQIQEELLNFLSTKEIFNQNGYCTKDTDLIEAGLDSMIMIELLLLIEEKYGFWVPESYLTEKNFKNVKMLAGSILTLMNNKINNNTEQ